MSFHFACSFKIGGKQSSTLSRPLPDVDSPLLLRACPWLSVKTPAKDEDAGRLASLAVVEEEEDAAVAAAVGLCLVVMFRPEDAER